MREAMTRFVYFALKIRSKAKRLYETRPFDLPFERLIGAYWDRAALASQVPKDIYQEIPCRIGNNYLRVTVKGQMLPCCSALHLQTGDLRQQNWKQVWFSTAQYAFRERAERMHLDHQHLTEPEWHFCQQCPHVIDNLNAHPAVDDRPKSPTLDRAAVPKPGH